MEEKVGEEEEMKGKRERKRGAMLFSKSPFQQI